MPTSLPMADPCGHDVTPSIPLSARSRGIPHAGQRALFFRHTCREVRADDVTHAPNPHGFPCRLARVHHPGSLLRVLREQNTWYEARDASDTRPRGNPHVPNSPNTRRYFNRPRNGLFRNAGRSRTGFLSRARPGRSENEKWTLDTTFCEAGTISTISTSGPFG